jgi:adenine phosphoribosyltransferase
MNLAKYIRDIPDFPKPGILFKDITPLLAEPQAFRQAITLMHEHYQGKKIDAVAAAEARGFLFAAPLALLMDRPLIPLRKPGKLPYKTIRATYALEYGTDALELHEDAISHGTRVLIHDDLLATGGTAKAKVDLVEQLGGIPVGAAFVIELSFLHGRDALAPLPVHSLMQFDSE